MDEILKIYEQKPFLYGYAIFGLCTKEGVLVKGLLRINF